MAERQLKSGNPAINYYGGPENGPPMIVAGGATRLPVLDVTRSGNRVRIRKWAER